MFHAACTSRAKYRGHPCRAPPLLRLLIHALAPCCELIRRSTASGLGAAKLHPQAGAVPARHSLRRLSAVPVARGMYRAKKSSMYLNSARTPHSARTPVPVRSIGALAAALPVQLKLPPLQSSLVSSHSSTSYPTSSSSTSSFSSLSLSLFPIHSFPHPVNRFLCRPPPGRNRSLALD